MNAEIVHLFPSIYKYKVIKQQVESVSSFTVELRANFRARHFSHFLEHFKNATGVPLKAKPHGTASTIGVKIAAKVEKVCRYADHQSGKASLNRVGKYGQPYDSHITSCGASVALTEKAPLNPNSSKKAHKLRLNVDPDLMDFPTVIVIKWNHYGHNIGVLDSVVVYIKFFIVYYTVY